MIKITYALHGAVYLLLIPAYSSAQAPAPAVEDKGVEVLARGPVHEGYAEPLEPKPTGGLLAPKQPPEPIDELPPDQKPAGDNVVWLPGYWSWDEDRADFIWVSGFWRVPPPNRVWMPGSWRQAADGWQWVGGFWGQSAEQQADIQYLPEPPAPVEAGPATPAPTPTSIYVPGCWVYRAPRYMWRPGYWVEHNPSWIWIPAHYRWTPCGYVFIDGYWDYPLATRGILFAPVYIPRTVYVASAYTYTPTIVVQENCMYGALFVRSGRGCYYFGDYFGPTYASAGYVSWVGYSGGSSVVVVRGWYDPMYSYYRVSYRDDPYWRGGITELYVGRYRGDIAPPPRTLVQQTTIINNTVVNNTVINNNTTVVNKNVTNVQMLTPIGQIAKTNPAVKMQTITAQARLDQQTAARHINVVAQQRGQVETQLVTKSSGPPRATDAPHSVKIDVSKNVTATASVTAVHGTNNGLPHGQIPPASNTQPPKHDLPIVPSRVPTTNNDPRLPNHTGPHTQPSTNSDPRLAPNQTGPLQPSNPMAPKHPAINPATPMNGMPTTTGVNPSPLNPALKPMTPPQHVPPPPVHTPPPKKPPEKN